MFDFPHVGGWGVGRGRSESRGGNGGNGAVLVFENSILLIRVQRYRGIGVGRGVCSFCKTTMNKGSSIFPPPGRFTQSSATSCVVAVILLVHFVY